MPCELVKGVCFVGFWCCNKRARANFLLCDLHLFFEKRLENFWSDPVCGDLQSRREREMVPIYEDVDSYSSHVISRDRDQPLSHITWSAVHYPRFPLLSWPPSQSL